MNRKESFIGAKQLTEIDPFGRLQRPVVKEGRALLDDTDKGEHPKSGIMFSAEAYTQLQNRGYLIYELKGQSIKTLAENGCVFWTTLESEAYSLLKKKTAELTECAINPLDLLLKNSNAKTLSEQEEMMEDFSNSLKIPGVKAIIAEVPDYAEVAFEHFEETGEYLLGKKSENNYIRTKTLTSEMKTADIGGYNSHKGFGIGDLDLDKVGNRLYSAPLLVPSDKNIYE